jgi:molybdopterin converting factor small subunit
MSVYVNIHRTHRNYTDGLNRVSVEGQTVGDCLKALIQKYPGLRTILFSQTGALRNHFEIYLNAESAYPDELKKPVSDGDEIYITALLAGG